MATRQVSSVPSVQKLFEAIEDELSLDEFRPLNQRYWGIKIGMTQMTVSSGLATLCRDGVIELGPSDGNQKQYRLKGS